MGNTNIKNEIHYNNFTFRQIKTINVHLDKVYSLLMLNDKRIASCSEDRRILIFDPSNDYHCDKEITRYSESNKSFCQLKDNTLVYPVEDRSISLGSYTINRAHNIKIIKVISLPNNRIASCSADGTIKIWKSNPPYSNIPIKVLEGHKDWVTSMIYVREKNLLISGSCDESIIFWNMTTYQCVCRFRNISWVRSPNALYQIDNERIIVGAIVGFVIINFDKFVIENWVTSKNEESFDCFIKLRDNKTILCGCDKGKLCLYDMYTKAVTITNKSHASKINDILTIDKETFMTCSDDKYIKVWKY